MGPLFVVADEPFSGHATHFAQGFKHVAVEHLLSIGSIEAFDVAVLHGFTRLDKAQLNTVTTRPARQGFTDELRTIVGSEHLRSATDLDQLIQSPHDAGRGQVRVDLYT